MKRKHDDDDDDHPSNYCFFQDMVLDPLIGFLNEISLMMLCMTNKYFYSKKRVVLVPMQLLHFSTAEDVLKYASQVKNLFVGRNFLTTQHTRNAENQELKLQLFKNVNFLNWDSPTKPFISSTVRKLKLSIDSQYNSNFNFLTLPEHVTELSLKIIYNPKPVSCFIKVSSTLQKLTINVAVQKFKVGVSNSLQCLNGLLNLRILDISNLRGTTTKKSQIFQEIKHMSHLQELSLCGWYTNLRDKIVFPEKLTKLTMFACPGFEELEFPTSLQILNIKYHQNRYFDVRNDFLPQKLHALTCNIGFRRISDWSVFFPPTLKLIEIWMFESINAVNLFPTGLINLKCFGLFENFESANRYQEMKNLDNSNYSGIYLDDDILGCIFIPPNIEKLRTSAKRFAKIYFHDKCTIKNLSLSFQRGCECGYLKIPDSVTDLRLKGEQSKQEISSYINLKSDQLTRMKVDERFFDASCGCFREKTFPNVKNLTLYNINFHRKCFFTLYFPNVESITLKGFPQKYYPEAVQYFEFDVDIPESVTVLNILTQEFIFPKIFPKKLFKMKTWILSQQQRKKIKYSYCKRESSRNEIYYFF